MKILALTCGRKMANCEILTKEALMGAEEVGAKVEFIRMLDLDIKHCDICWPCPSLIKGPGACIHKDDGPFLFEKIMDCDALLISAPVYACTPPGYLMAIRDRLLGPKVDTASALENQQSQGTDERFKRKAYFDERMLKNRVGAFISVGGAVSLDWVTMGLPLLHSLTFPMSFKIVDQMQVRGVADDGAITLKDTELKKAHTLGRHLAEGMKLPFEKVQFKGSDPGFCPVCHCNVMVMDKDSNIICAACGVKGTLTGNGKTITPNFTEEEQRKSHILLEGKKLHHFEIWEVIKQLEPNLKKIPVLMEKYKNYKTPTLPPSKEAKNKRIAK